MSDVMPISDPMPHTRERKVLQQLIGYMIARQTRRGALISGVCILLIFVYLGPEYLSLNDIVLAFTLFTYMTLAQAWNVVGGFGGQFSLGHCMFVGVGAYSTGVLLLHTSIPLAAAIPLSGLIACAIGGIAALPLIRLRGVYFAVGSLGVALAAQAWMVNWSYTGQTSGLNLPPEAAPSFTTLYYLAAGLATLTTVVAAVTVKSRFGLRLMAVRDNENAAGELGVRASTVKLAAFALSAFLIGLAGSLVAVQQLSLEPYSSFGLTWTINMIIMTVIGGLATLVGPLIGALTIFSLQQQLQSHQDWSTLIEGALLIVIVRLAPGGIWGVIKMLPQRLIAIWELLASRPSGSTPKISRRSST